MKLYKPNLVKMIVLIVSLLSSCDGVSNSPFHHMIAGGFATAMADFLLHPIDSVKVLQQSHKIKITIPQAVKMISSKNGLAGFYRGAIWYATVDGLNGAVFFATYEFIKNKMDPMIPEKFSSISPFIYSSLAIMVSSIFLVPGELIKQRLQTSSLTWVQCLKSTVSLSNGGIKGLYTGYTSTLSRDLPYYAFQLGFYENIKKSLIRLSGQPTRLDVGSEIELLSGLLAGSLTAILTNPMDVVTARLMQQNGHVKVYQGVTDCFSRICSEEGAHALLLGVGARVAWTAPYTSIYFSLNENAKRFLDDKKNKS